MINVFDSPVIFARFSKIYFYSFSLSINFIKNHSYIYRQNIINKFNLNPKQGAILKQIHSLKVSILNIHNIGSGYDNKKPFIDNSDALISRLPNSFITIYTADCVPIFIYFSDKNIICGIHSGLIGTINNITKKTILLAQKKFNVDPAASFVYIGPSIKKCCYKLSLTDSRLKHRDIMTSLNFKKNNDKYIVDLISSITPTLSKFHIPHSNIEISSHCTCCHKFPIYPSHHRQKNTRSRTIISLFGLK